MADNSLKANCVTSFPELIPLDWIVTFKSRNAESKILQVLQNFSSLLSAEMRGRQTKQTSFCMQRRLYSVCADECYRYNEKFGMHRTATVPQLHFLSISARKILCVGRFFSGWRGTSFFWCVLMKVILRRKLRAVFPWACSNLAVIAARLPVSYPLLQLRMLHRIAAAS